MIDVILDTETLGNDLGDPQAGPKIGRKAGGSGALEQDTFQARPGLVVERRGAARCGPRLKRRFAAFQVRRFPAPHTASVDAQLAGDLDRLPTWFQQLDGAMSPSFQRPWTARWSQAHEPLTQILGY